MVAIRKASGGVRGLVVGDFLRRLVARSLAQHYATDFEAACHPHQYALSTRAGTEALFHTLQLTTETDHRQTVLSFDGIGAYDHVSRNAMLRGLANTPHAQAALPFARLFYSQPSTYLWTDDHGQTHPITQAEGGEQGDPLMPALFSLALDFALRAFQADLLPGERVMAFLDDIYITAPPPRIRPLFDSLSTHLLQHTHIQLHHGKTQIWNASGEEPANIRSLGQDASNPVWVGDTALPSNKRGLRVLGLPLGTPTYVQTELNNMRAAHQPLLNALTTLPDLQTSWLLLLYCASPRAHYALRGIRPDLTGTYATAHDAAVIACLAQLLDHQHGALPEHASHRAHLALDQGGLGLRSAHHHTAAAYWASWHYVAPIIQRKSPNLFTHITEQLTTAVDSATPSIQCLQHVQEFLRNLGLEAPAWAECAPPGPPTQAELPQQLRGWQQAASTVIDQAYANFVEASADPAGQALLESQRGPHASRTFTLLPTSPELTFEPAHFRVLLLRFADPTVPLPEQPSGLPAEAKPEHTQS
ncbi:Retrovirus-related Pol polyprotein from type-1 retrotransposable element R2 (Retrovirus-related Pol polyprotein from type I retrotransposable element R2) [Includes: Reverse transcriptase [Durusdinium trenchii]|uniref:Retrovirus-related Pol polyprotein from type-1 retrotransposable element R2 (Retrovirus-related Pol polyprotein from type I retrotransposable element R2) n=1 Tax=Durusdinium trenchii TaxID=1381693 RepID=A0ABP0MJE5_9DINO